MPSRPTPNSSGARCCRHADGQEHQHCKSLHGIHSLTPFKIQTTCSPYRPDRRHRSDDRSDWKRPHPGNSACRGKFQPRRHPDLGKVPTASALPDGLRGRFLDNCHLASQAPGSRTPVRWQRQEGSSVSCLPTIVGDGSNERFAKETADRNVRFRAPPKNPPGAAKSRSRNGMDVANVAAEKF